MISEFTRRQLTPDLFRTRPLDVIRVKGKSQAVLVHEVLGEVSDPLDPKDEAYARAYEEGFTAYLSRDFEAARKGFDAALAIRPDDPASRDILSRMADLNPRALPENWDGSIALTSK
jgi:adenylate cyclase